MARNREREGTVGKGRGAVAHLQPSAGGRGAGKPAADRGPEQMNSLKASVGEPVSALGARDTGASLHTCLRCSRESRTLKALCPMQPGAGWLAPADKARGVSWTLLSRENKALSHSERCKLRLSQCALDVPQQLGTG